LDKRKPKDTILEITQLDKASQRRERIENPCPSAEAEALPASEPAAVTYTYKDRIFRMIFKDKKEFLGLYNAMNDSDHDNPDDLTVTTLDNAIYMGMRNDVSFVLYDKLMLYEHQSTKNPNIPLRNLFYVSDIYSKLTKDENLFGTKQIKIPEPKFVVFYNGITAAPEQSTLKLSDMFKHSYEPASKFGLAFESESESASESSPASSSGHSHGQPSLELITQVFNINLGYNKALMEKCRTLHDYAVFVDFVRRYQKRMPLESAVERAIHECIAADVLADFLKENRAEVVKMGLYEYDEEKFLRMEREYFREVGQQEGFEKGKLYSLTPIVRNMHRKGRALEVIADELDLALGEIMPIYELIAENPKMTDDEIVKELSPEPEDLY